MIHYNSYYNIGSSYIWYHFTVSHMNLSESESESESALFAKCVQTHEEFVVVFKKLLVHTYIHINKHIWHENRTFK